MDIFLGVVMGIVLTVAFEKTLYFFKYSEDYYSDAELEATERTIKKVESNNKRR